MVATWTQDPVGGFQRIGRTFRKVFRGTGFTDGSNVPPAHGFSTVTSEDLKVVHTTASVADSGTYLEAGVGAARDAVVPVGTSATVGHAFYTVEGY